MLRRAVAIEQGVGLRVLRLHLRATEVVLPFQACDLARRRLAIGGDMLSLRCIRVTQVALRFSYAGTAVLFLLVNRWKRLVGAQGFEPWTR